MRNLKKVLTLVLTLAMLLSVMVVGAGAATFGDQESITNKEAVDVCTTLNIIGGYEDGTFRPTGNVTRAEMCKMICVALNGGKEPTMGSNSVNTFNDVANDNWAKPYIEYCVSEGIVGGVGGGNFNPAGNITGTQAAKMLLCILGYNASIAGYVGNDNWEMKINVDASSKHLYDGITGIDASAALTRDQAAQMIWNALQANEVEYVNTFVPGPNGTLISQATVRDKVVGSNNDYITLLRDKYNAYIDVGTLVGIAGDKLSIQWNGSDKIESDHYVDEDTTASAPVFTKLTVDYSSLLGEKVKVVTKDGKTNEVLGVFSTDDNTVYNTVVNAVDINKDKNKIEVNGELYSIDSNGVNVYVNKVDGNNTTTPTNVGLAKFANGADPVVTGLTNNNQSADFIKFVDSNGDAKIDTAIINQVSIGEVGYVSSEKVIVETTTYETADNNIAEDVAEDDYAVITWNRFDECNDVVKAQKITSAALNGTKTAPNKYMLGDTWYVEMAGVPAADMHGVKAGDVIDAWVYNGVIAYAKRSSGENATLADVCVVLAKGQNIEGDKVKVLKLDTSTTEIVTMDTNPGAGYIANPKTDLDLGSVYEYSVKDGEYRFKALNTTDDYFGDYTSMNTGSITSSRNGTSFTGSTSTAPTENLKVATVGTDRTLTKTTADKTVTGTVSDSAKIVLIRNYKDGAANAAIDYKVVTGKQFKTLAVGASNASDPYEVYTDGGIAAFTSKVDGVTRVTYAVVAVEGLKPAFELADNYGYITATDYTAPDGYIVYTVWTGSESVTVQEKNSVPRAKGEIIGYSSIQAKGDNDAFATIKDVSSPNFVMGAATVNDAKDKISLDGSSQLNITSSTKILYIDSANYKGMESGTLRDASTEGGKKLMNVAIIKDGTKDLALLVYDVTNKLTNMTSNLPSDATVTDINNALLVGDANLSNSAGISIDNDVNIPAGNTLTLDAGSGAVTLASGKTMDVKGNLVVDSAFTDANGTINVAETGTLTLNAAMTNTTVPTITGTGNVVVTANGAVNNTVAFGNIQQNEFEANGAATPVPVQVGEGLKLSGPAKVTNFSGSLTLDQLAKRTDSTTVTPYQLNLLGAKGALDDNNKAKLNGKLTLEDGKVVDCIFTGEKNEIMIGSKDYTGIDVQGNLDTENDLYMSVTIGNKVKSLTYTLAPVGDTSANNGTTLKWTFTF